MYIILLNNLASGPTRRPGLLKIVTPEPSGNIQHFANEITEQTYFEAWDNNIRVRQDRKDPKEALIWENEKSPVREFLTELQTSPLLQEEAAQIRQGIRGSESIQSMEKSILAGWDLKALAMTLAAKAATKASTKPVASQTLTSAGPEKVPETPKPSATS